MKKILSYSLFATGILFLAGVVFFCATTFNAPAKVQALTYTLPNPAITLGNAAYSLSLPSDGPFNEDFKIRVCLSAPDNNGWGPICFTSPWASQVNSGGNWATTEQIQGGITPFSNTGNWSVWAYPGHGDELENQGQGAPATVQVIPGSPLPAGEIITNLNLGLQLSEDNNGNIAGTMTDPDNCHTGGPSRTGDSGPGYVATYAFSMSPGHCNYGFSPDVARMYMNDTIENAQASSDNVPTTFTVSQTKSIGTDMNPLEITVKNTGSTAWQIGWSGGQFSLTGPETGACDDPVSACPDPTSEPVGAQCVSSGRWIGSSNPTGLQHVSGSFSVATDPAQYEQYGTNTCGVVMGCSNPNTGNASCQRNQFSCEGFQSGEGCVDTSAPDWQTCSNNNETWDGQACINSNYTPYNNAPGSQYYNQDVYDCGQAGDTFVDPVCDGTWGPMDNVTTTGYDTPPGGTAQFLLSSLTAPSTPGTYTEDWQMENGPSYQWVPYYDATLGQTYDALYQTSQHNFGDIIPITITVKGSAAPTSTISVTVTASPTTINTSGTSQCSAVVNGSSDQNVTWSVTGPGTIDSASGLLTATGPGTVTCIAAPEADPTSSGSATITVAGPAGTIVVNSVNSVYTQIPVTSTWGWPVNVGPTDITCQTNHTDSNQAANIMYTIIPQYACGNGSSGQYSLNSVKNAPIASASPKTLKEQILAFAKNMLIPAANAYSVSPASSLTLLPSSTLNFTILWDPIADISLNPDPVSLSASASGTPVSSTVVLTNDGAPGSELTWTSTVNATSTSWLSVSPSSDASQLAAGSSDNLRVTANPGSLAAGTYTGTITFSGVSVIDGGSPIKTLTVTFTINPAGGGSGGGGGSACGASPCPAPACTLSASPNQVIIPQQSSLSYNCSNVTSCSLSGGNISSPITINANASGTVNGTTKVSPTGNSIYTISCSGSGGNTSASVPVNIGNSNLCESNPGGVNCPGK